MGLILIVVAVSIMAASALASFVVLRAIRRNPPPRRGRGRRKSVDLVPQGGGIAVIPVLSFAWLSCAVLGVATSGVAIVALAMAGLTALSLQDIRVGVPPLYRYTAQAIAVVLGLIFLPGSGHLFRGALPVTLDLGVTTVVWMGAMQAIPWSDRREGSTAVSLTTIGFGAAAVAFLAGDRDSGEFPLGIAAAAAALGYLPWAWPPSRLLLGPVGTIPIGYALAWLLLALAGRGHWAAALILSSHLLARLLVVLRERILASRDRAQAPAPARRQTSLKPEAPGIAMATIVAAETMLVGLACLATYWPWPALLGAAVVVVKLTRSVAGLSGLGFRRI